MRRREFMRIGLGGLALPGILRAREVTGVKAKGRAVILVWLRGGCSHLDTYDPKPHAPSEYRSPFDPIFTNVPGLQLTELLPRHAKIADKFTLLRSMVHNGGGHPAGSLQMLTGDTASADKPKPIHPDWMSLANYLKRSPDRALPNYIGVNPVTRYDSFTITGQGHLGPAYGPFTVSGDPNAPKFEVPNIGLKDTSAVERLQGRVSLKDSLDSLDRATDISGSIRAFDEYESQAMQMLTSARARRAFDLSRESDKTRDRYGRNRWGQQLLLARRLVEAGVEIITSELSGPLCGRVSNWDDHAVNHHIFDALKFRMPTYDQAVTALIEDIYQRGLDEKVLVCVSGEFGRTPRISRVASSGGGVASGKKGTVQPGRDHWPRAFTNLWSGGGIETGGIIGASDKRGEDSTIRRTGPRDFMATLYHHLGIDAANGFMEVQGRPVPIMPAPGKPVPELMGRA
jgi:hypothetical protein